MKEKVTNKSDENVHFYSIATSHCGNHTKYYSTKMLTDFILYSFRKRILHVLYHPTTLQKNTCYIQPFCVAQRFYVSDQPKHFMNSLHVTPSRKISRHQRQHKYLTNRHQYMTELYTEQSESEPSACRQHKQHLLLQCSFGASRIFMWTIGIYNNTNIINTE